MGQKRVTNANRLITGAVVSSALHNYSHFGSLKFHFTIKIESKATIFPDLSFRIRKISVTTSFLLTRWKARHGY
jgi:hypothetical protein